MTFSPWPRRFRRKRCGGRRGFDHHRPGVHRRDRRCAGPQAAHRRDHRAGDARRTAFEAALSERLGLLAGIAEAHLATVFRQRLTLMPGARTLIATMKAAGAFTALVSGGFTFLTHASPPGSASTPTTPTRSRSPAAHDRQVAGPILGREAKLAALEQPARTRPRPSHARGRRRRQRPRHDQGGRARRRLSCQAARRRRGAPHQPRRPHRTALSAGLYEEEEFVEG